jgi:hypothetical protein
VAGVALIWGGLGIVGLIAAAVALVVCRRRRWCAIAGGTSQAKTGAIRHRRADSLSFYRTGDLDGRAYAFGLWHGGAPTIRMQALRRFHCCRCCKSRSASNASSCDGR